MRKLINFLTGKATKLRESSFSRRNDPGEVPAASNKVEGICETSQPKHQDEVESIVRRHFLSGISDSESDLNIDAKNKLSVLGFQPEGSAEEYHLSNRGPVAEGTFFLVSETAAARDEEEWELDATITASASKTIPTSTHQESKDTSDLSGISFRRFGPLPSFAVRGDEAAALKAAIGGDAANLAVEDTMAVVRLAGRLGMPVVVAGKGLLAQSSNLGASDYVVSTLGSRSSTGNFIHALVVSPLISAEEVMSTEAGRIWLASIIRKEQLLVSYRPIRGVISCEDLDERAKTMPIDPRVIISKQRGLGGYA